MNDEATLDELTKFLLETTHKLDKAAYPDEKVYINEILVQQHVGPTDSYFKHLKIITPLTIKEILFVELPCEPPSIETIADWLREARKCENPDNTEALFLYEDDESYYQLCYTRSKRR